MPNYYINSISGIWNSYGCPPEEGEGITLSLERTDDDNESLIDICEFDEHINNIGTLADSKEISELVVLLPTIDKKYVPAQTESTSVATSASCGECDENNIGCDEISTQQESYDKKINNNLFIRDRYSGMYQFAINPEIINKILDVKDYTELDIFEIKYILDNKTNLNDNNNIVKLMKAMVNYNFPPYLNWLLYKKIKPCVMYVAEFKSTLSKNDLSHIWQGTMPNLAKEPEEEEITIEHFLFEEEMFGNIDMSKLIGEIQLTIFKCKKRALTHYYKVSRFRPSNIPYRKWYNYNWPYDNFSLIELLKVEAGEIHDFKQTQTPEDGVLLQNVVVETQESSSTLIYAPKETREMPGTATSYWKDYL